MNPLLEALYNYVMEDEMSYYIDRKEYEESIKSSSFHEKVLKSKLTGELKEHLEYYIEASDTLECVQTEALFCAALSAGLALGMMQQRSGL